MLSTPTFTTIMGLITAGFGLATAYLNFRTAQEIAKSKKRKQPWLR